MLEVDDMTNNPQAYACINNDETIRKNSSSGGVLAEKVLSKHEIAFWVGFDEAIKYNPSMISTVKPDPKRKEFFENLGKMPFDQLVKKYTYRRSLVRRVLSKIKQTHSLIHNLKITKNFFLKKYCK